MDQKDVSQWVGGQLATQTGQLQVNEVLLVLLLLDDSSSIEAAGNTEAVIEGYNAFIEALKNAPGDVRVKTDFLNNPAATPFQRPCDVQTLTRSLYHPDGNTPLFLRSTQALNDIISTARAFSQQGVRIRTMTFIFTDGGDNGSREVLANNVKTIVDVMLTTGTHIVGGCAVNDGRTNFWQVFASMGIPEQWVKVLKSDHREVSESIAQLGAMSSFASRDAESFSQTSVSGFRQSPPTGKK